MPIVLDSSLLLASMLPDPRGIFSESIIDASLVSGGHAPALMPFEVANVMTRSLRQGLINEADRLQQLRIFAALPIVLEPPPDVDRLVAISGVADQYGLSGYDAAFLEQALRLGAELATLDGPLADAGWLSGLTVHHIEKDLTQRPRP